MEKRKIILDCDPGHDDAVAMMMAMRHPALELLGITAVAGNQTCDKTLHNALAICQHLGVDVPVYGGMVLPLVREQVTAGYVHGETGLDGAAGTFAPLTRKAEEKHAVPFIIDALMASDGDITLVPVGPLTNIAVAMRTEPRIVGKIREIVLMGGAVGLGNITAAAEFNIYADPEAAHVVFTSGAPIVMMGLDLTYQTACSLDTIRRMEAGGNAAGKLFGDVMRYTHKSEGDVYGLEGGPIHDAVCVAYLIDPGCFTVKEMVVDIDISHGVSYGRTVCDFHHHVTDRKPNAKVGITIDNDRFWDIVEDCVKLYS